MFECGVGILQTAEHTNTGEYITVSLKEPLVVIAGVEELDIGGSMISNDSPAAKLSSLGLMWESVVADT